MHHLLLAAAAIAGCLQRSRVVDSVAACLGLQYWPQTSHWLTLAYFASPSSTIHLSLLGWPERPGHLLQAALDSISGLVPR